MLLAILLPTLGEFIYYWLHHAQHESLFWWRIHAVHQHITKMGAARADRTQPLEFLALFMGMPIVLALSGTGKALSIWQQLTMAFVSTKKLTEY